MSLVLFPVAAVDLGPPLNFLLTLLPLRIFEPVGNQAAVFSDVVLELFPLLHAVLGQLLRVIDLLLGWLCRQTAGEEVRCALKPRWRG